MRPKWTNNKSNKLWAFVGLEQRPNVLFFVSSTSHCSSFYWLQNNLSLPRALYVLQHNVCMHVYTYNVYIYIYIYIYIWGARTVMAVSSVIRQKGESHNGCFKKTKHAKFSETPVLRFALLPYYRRTAAKFSKQLLWSITDKPQNSLLQSKL